MCRHAQVRTADVRNSGVGGGCSSQCGLTISNIIMHQLERVSGATKRSPSITAKVLPWHGSHSSCPPAYATLDGSNELQQGNNFVWNHTIQGIPQNLAPKSQHRNHTGSFRKHGHTTFCVQMTHRTQGCVKTALVPARHGPRTAIVRRTRSSWCLLPLAWVPAGSHAWPARCASLMTRSATMRIGSTRGTWCLTALS